jgi:hypothetical protein
MISKLLKNKIQLIIVVVTIGLFFSCKNQSEVDNTSLIVEDTVSNIKPSLKEQLKNEAGYGNLNKKDLNNLNIINGFRNVKLGSDINSYSLDGCDKSHSTINTKYSNVEFNFNNDHLELGNGKVSGLTLRYLEDKLKYIEFIHNEAVINSFDVNSLRYVPEFREHSLVTTYLEIFGNPTKTTIYDNRSLYINDQTVECTSENWENCINQFCETYPNYPNSIVISLLWKNEKLSYELLLFKDTINMYDEQIIKKMKECQNNGSNYYSNEMSIIQIYENDENLVEKLEQLQLDYLNNNDSNKKNNQAMKNAQGL